jgi:hypothetical protein
VVVLAILAPLASAQLDNATHTARERGVALALDARLPPQDKLQLAPALLTDVNTENPRAQLRSAIDDARGNFSGAERAEFDHLAKRAEETLVAAVGDAFDEAFLITGALGVLAALVLVLTLGVPVRRALAFAALALLAVPAYAAARNAVAPEPVRIADPCVERRLPETGGLTGALQDTALRALDRAACRYGSSREELVLALADSDEARRFEDAHGVNPRSLGGILDALFG